MERTCTVRQDAPIVSPYSMDLADRHLVLQRPTGKVLLPARLLAWYPRAALGSGVMEALIAHREGRVDERMLKLVRVQTSFAIPSPAPSAST